MNDFTKEELEELHCVWASILDVRAATFFEATLLNKLESMIDNYCEPCKHRETNFDDGIYYCNECGHCVP